ncbi:PREDICTED: uncharacterized protein LOC109152878 [Ipomoea nil]|uniref:uncharacterized protein LOC109152878 n=1 Tax=Ipomoea nil TaxID=35883 RepID=UPI0009009360|nr:PREDICTED: uncharacterized protein LOC109152878 [Ipomoea nil]
MASARVVTVLMVAAAVVLLAAAMTEAQEEQLPSCAEKLIPCIEYLNSTGELAPCCDGLREVLANEVPCLCKLARDHGLLSFSKVEGDESPRSPYDLPRLCGVSDTIHCDDDGDGAPPPVVEHSTANGAGRMITRTAISSLLLLGVLLMML